MSTDQVKIFTPREANQRLPLVKRIVEDVLSVGDKIRTLSLEIGSGAEGDPRIIRLMDQLEELFGELESLGCFYKDWNFTMGLVDFPAVINGQEVYLCWRSDEKTLQYYHDAESGYAGRKPIPRELL